MRASASANFQPEDIPQIVEICKKNNIKSYITINTVMYDNDLPRMKKIIDLVKKHGVNAIIASDMAVIQHARKHNIEVHISTQTSISNIEAVTFYAQFADRMVLARELSLDQVTSIVDQIKTKNITGPKGKLIEIEIFAHGALCVAVSGRCSMSLYADNSSANRGMCHHICRRPYKITDIGTGKELVVDNNFVMSSADLCTIGMLDLLIGSGITCLKFEGRGRTPEYVHTVISTYKEALQSIEEKTYTQEKIDTWNKKLGTVFNRGFTQNFYLGQPIEAWSKGPGNKATSKRVQIGVIQKYYPKIKVAQVLIQTKETLHTDEKISISGKTTGLVTPKLNQMMIDDKIVTQASQGDVITFKCFPKVRKNDQVYVTRPS